MRAAGQQSFDLRQHEQLVLGVDQAVPPTPRICAVRPLEPEARTEGLGGQIAEPASIPCVAQLLQERPTADWLWADCWGDRAYPVVADIDKRGDHVVAIQFPQL